MEELFNLKYSQDSDYLKLYFISITTKNAIIVEQEFFNKRICPQVMKQILAEVGSKSFFKLIKNLKSRGCRFHKEANFPPLDKIPLTLVQQFIFFHCAAHLMCNHDNLDISVELKEAEADIVAFTLLSSFFKTNKMLFIIGGFDLHLTNVPTESCERTLDAIEKLKFIIRNAVIEDLYEPQHSIVINDGKKLDTKPNKDILSQRSHTLYTNDGNKPYNKPHREPQQPLQHTIYTNDGNKPQQKFNNGEIYREPQKVLINDTYKLEYVVSDKHLLTYFKNDFTGDKALFKEEIETVRTVDDILKNIVMPKFKIKYIPYEQLRIRNAVHGISGYQGDYDHPIVSVNPLTPYPDFALLHEIAHILLNHPGKDDNKMPHHIKELEANLTAFTVLNVFYTAEEMIKVAKACYLTFNSIPTQSARNIIKTSNKILEFIKRKI